MHRLVTLILGLSLAPICCWAAGPADRAKAIAEIEKLGGKVTIDEENPGKPVIGVDLGATQVTDEAAAADLPGDLAIASMDR